MKDQKLANEASENTQTAKPSLFGLSWGGSFEFIPALLAGIVVVGTFNINAYYFIGYRFRVSTYLDISEILLLSFVDLGRSFDIVILELLVITLGLFIFFRKSPDTWLFINYSMVLFTVTSLGGILLDILMKNKIVPAWLCIFFGVIGFIYFIFFLFEDLKGNNPNKLRKFIFIPIAYLCLLTLSSIENYQEINNLHSTFGSKIITDNDTLLSDSNHYYVGKTRNYAFMFSVKDSAMTIIPMSDIKKLVIHNGLPDKKTKPVKKN